MIGEPPGPTTDAAREAHAALRHLGFRSRRPAACQGMDVYQFIQP